MFQNKTNKRILFLILLNHLRYSCTCVHIKIIFFQKWPLYCVKYKKMNKKMTVNNYVWMGVLFTHCCEIESTLSRLIYYQLTKKKTLFIYIYSFLSLPFIKYLHISYIPYVELLWQFICISPLPSPTFCCKDRYIIGLSKCVSVRSVKVIYRARWETLK